MFIDLLNIFVFSYLCSDATVGLFCLFMWLFAHVSIDFCVYSCICFPKHVTTYFVFIVNLPTCLFMYKRVTTWTADPCS